MSLTAIFSLVDGGATKLRWGCGAEVRLRGVFEEGRFGAEIRGQGFFEGGDWASSCSCSARDAVAEARAMLLGLQQCRREVERQSVDEVIVIYDRGSVASCLLRSLRQRSMA